MLGMVSAHRWVLVMCCLLGSVGSGAAWGQSLFKWVDEDGVTHFSKTPPPTSEVAPDAVEEEQLENGQRKALRISGQWWDQRPGHRGDYLTLSYSSFEIGRQFMDDYGNMRDRTIASGPAKRDANAIEVTYFSNLDSPALLDQTERWSIVDVSDGELKLLLPGRIQPVVYRRLQRQSSSLFSVRLVGRWTIDEKPDVVYEFRNGTYRVFSARYGSGSSRVIREGNWHWSDPDLRLNLVAAFVPTADIGDQVWLLQDIGGSLIRAVDRKDNTQITLRRIP